MGKKEIIKAIKEHDCYNEKTNVGFLLKFKESQIKKYKVKTFNVVAFSDTIEELILNCHRMLDNIEDLRELDK